MKLELASTSRVSGFGIRDSGFGFNLEKVCSLTCTASACQGSCRQRRQSPTESRPLFHLACQSSAGLEREVSPLILHSLSLTPSNTFEF